MGNDILGTSTSYRGTAQGDSSVSFTLLAGVNRILFICTSALHPTVERNASGIQYGGQAATVLHTLTKSEVGEGKWNNVVAFILEADLPAIGAHNATATYNGSVTNGHRISVFCIEDATQETPPVAIGDAGFILAQNHYEDDITVATAGDTIFGKCAPQGGAPFTENSGQTEFAVHSAGDPDHTFTYKDGQAAGAQEQKWTYTAVDWHCVQLWTVTPLNIPTGSIPIMF